LSSFAFEDAALEALIGDSRHLGGFKGSVPCVVLIVQMRLAVFIIECILVDVVCVGLAFFD
jgi:hypothetical protein